MKCLTCNNDLAVYGTRCCACRRDALERMLWCYIHDRQGNLVGRRGDSWYSQSAFIDIRRCSIARDGDGHRSGVSFSLREP